jgi:hypothetical protein
MPWHDLSSPELGDHQAADLVSTTQSIDKAGRGGKGSFSPHSYSYVEWWTRSWVPLLLITGYNTIDCPFILSLKSFGRSSALRFVERGKKKSKHGRTALDRAVSQISCQRHLHFLSLFCSGKHHSEPFFVLPLLPVACRVTQSFPASRLGIVSPLPDALSPFPFVRVSHWLSRRSTRKRRAEDKRTRQTLLHRLVPTRRSAFRSLLSGIYPASRTAC